MDRTVLIAGWVSYFKDDLSTLCEECGRTLFFRPYWKEKVDRGEIRVLCLPCAAKSMGESEPELVVVPQTREELRALGVEDSIIDEALRRVLSDLMELRSSCP